MRKGVRGFKPFKGLPLRDFFPPCQEKKKGAHECQRQDHEYVLAKMCHECNSNMTGRDGAASYTQEVRGCSEAVGSSMQT